MKILDYLINKLHYISDGKKKRKIRLDHFLELFFKDKQKKFIIQVGGNDGINSDPLRKYFKKKINGRILIFEPLDYYFLKLKKLYKNKKNIKILKIALSNKIEKKKIFFIDPKIARSMDGKGPGKGWAHGQGSFSKNVVIYWIKKNKSRGQNYIKNINKYIKSIKYKEIHTKKISTFKIPKDNLSLLLIDVQGFELEVLKGMNWNNSPDFIVYEDDLKIYNNKSNLIRKILKKKGYVYLGGKYDKIFSKKISNMSDLSSE